MADTFALIEHVCVGTRHSEVKYAPQELLEDVFLLPSQGKAYLLFGWFVVEPNEGHSDLLLLAFLLF